MDWAMARVPLMQSFPRRLYAHFIRGFLGSHNPCRTVSHKSFQIHSANTTIPSATPQPPPVGMLWPSQHLHISPDLSVLWPTNLLVNWKPAFLFPLRLVPGWHTQCRESAPVSAPSLYWQCQSLHGSSHPAAHAPPHPGVFTESPAAITCQQDRRDPHIHIFQPSLLHSAHQRGFRPWVHSQVPTSSIQFVPQPWSTTFPPQQPELAAGEMHFNKKKKKKALF